VQYVLTAALRDKLLSTLMLMIATGAAVSVFLGSASITEKESFALVFGASGLRFLSVVGLVLFCCFYMRRSFETKEVEFLLARPLSRLTFLFSHAAAFMLLSLVIGIVTVVAVSFIGAPNSEGLMLWGISIVFELMMMSTAALFFSMVVSSAAGSALATLGLYVLARLSGMLLAIAQKAPDNMIYAVLNNVMNVISIFIPRLDMTGQTSWLVYGYKGSGETLELADRASDFAIKMADVLGALGFILTQGILFTGLLLAAAAFDFVRREF
jgi:ABC-type transport system involved in multi-copper enzyme maturation permease subunit